MPTMLQYSSQSEKRVTFYDGRSYTSPDVVMISHDLLQIVSNPADEKFIIFRMP